MKTDINIYIITSEHLKSRFNHLNYQINKLKTIFTKLEFNINFIQINNPSINEIEKTIDTYKQRVNTNKDDIEDNDFKNLISTINIHQLSNYIKQQKAMEMIKNGNCHLNFIIEDDVMFIDDFNDNFSKVLEMIKTLEFDLFFTSIAINNKDDDYKAIKSFEPFKVLIAKSSYFITKKCASNLFEYLNNIKFNYKIQLSYYIWENRETIKSFIFNKNLLFEGSKIGIFYTSINNNNFLYQNGEYIKLTQIMGNNEYIDDDILKEAENIYNNNGKNNADFQHTLGLLYYKNKNYKKAKETMIDAVMNLHKNDGYISSQNELLNNCINMHQFEQSDIENVLKLDGIYS